jgi:hypothetical protein
MRSTSRTFAEHLLLRSSPLSKLLGHARQLAAADQILRESLGSPLADHVRLANLRDGRAILHVDSAATLTLLRFRQQELLQVLQSRAGIECDRLELGIDPTLFGV